MKKTIYLILLLLLCQQLNAQLLLNPLDDLENITPVQKDRTLSFQIDHGFKLVPDAPVVPQVIGVSFGHVWTRMNTTQCEQVLVSPLQGAGFESYGNEHIENNMVMNGSFEITDSLTLLATPGDLSNEIISDSCESKSIANSFITVSTIESDEVSGQLQTVGFSQGIINPSKEAEAYSFCMSGVSIIEGRDLLKGQIDWDPVLVSHLLGKVKGIRQKGGTNDPIVYYVRDSTGLSLDSGTLFSVKMSFNSGDDTTSKINYWQNDTVHIESDSAEFMIQFPTGYTSLNGYAHLKVEGGIVTLSDDSGYFDGRLPLTGSSNVNFFLDDHISFHYNLDTLASYNQDSLWVKIFMYGNSENNLVKAYDTIIFASPAIIAPSCFGAFNGSINISISEGISPYVFLWSNGATTQNLTGLPAGTITVTVTDSLGVSASHTYIIPQPAALAIGFNITNVTCSGGSNGVLTALPTGGTVPYIYLWNNGSTTATVSGLTAGTYTVTVIDANGCSTTASTLLVALNSIPAQPALINGSVVVCKNSYVNYSIPVVAGATGYTWIATSGASVFSGQNSTNATVYFSPSATNASLSVTASNVCGSGPPRILSYSVSSVIPSPPVTINGQLNGVCNLLSVPYYCPAVSNATSYLWTVPAGALILTGQGTNAITVKYTPAFTGTGNISVAAVSGCGSSTACTKTLNAKPQKPVISGANWACKNQTGVAYSVAPVSGANSYTWSIVPGSTLLSGQGTTTIVLNWGNINGQIKCTANNSCGSSQQATLAVSFTCKEQSDISEQSELNLFPNPSTGSVTLQLESLDVGNGQLLLIDLTGRKVFGLEFQISTGSNMHEINLSSLPKGIYIVKCTINGEEQLSKLVMQ